MPSTTLCEGISTNTSYCRVSFDLIRASPPEEMGGPDIFSKKDWKCFELKNSLKLHVVLKIGQLSDVMFDIAMDWEILIPDKTLGWSDLLLFLCFPRLLELTLGKQYSIQFEWIYPALNTIININILCLNNLERFCCCETGENTECCYLFVLLF